jgi:hypothetical protein
MSPKTMKAYLSDELLEKVKKLHTALDQANNIVLTLSEENERLKSVLDKVNSNKLPEFQETK